jgi:hypothetical protein
MRYTTLKEIDRAGFDVRLWCFLCGRGATIDGIIWSLFEDRGWSIDLISARQRFPCKTCRSSADVLIIPARAQRSRQVSTTAFVAAYFHGLRGQGKRAKKR